jgi:hypothetical protein
MTRNSPVQLDAPRRAWFAAGIRLAGCALVVLPLLSLSSRLIQGAEAPGREPERPLEDVAVDERPAELERIPPITPLWPGPSLLAARPPAYARRSGVGRRIHGSAATYLPADRGVWPNSRHDARLSTAGQYDRYLAHRTSLGDLSAVYYPGWNLGSGHAWHYPYRTGPYYGSRAYYGGYVYPRYGGAWGPSFGGWPYWSGGRTGFIGAGVGGYWLPGVVGPGYPWYYRRGLAGAYFW